MLKQDKAKCFSLQVCFFIFVLVFVFLTSWGSNKTVRAQSGKAAKTVELKVAVTTMPRHLNPAVQSGTQTGIPGSQLFASLLRIDRNWEYHPYLAKAWEVAEDGLSLTFYLRDNATFHDGTPITSEDVAFSILAVKKHHPFSTMLGVVKAIETPDPLTAVVRLEQSHPALLLVAASPMLPIMPKHVYGDGQDLKKHPANWKVVGSGPFQIVEVNDKEIVLERHKGFFLSGKPYLDRVIFKIMSPRSQQVAFEVDAVHLKGFSSELPMNKQLEENDFVVDYDGYAGVGPIMWLAFNLKKPPFDDLRVRQAFAYAIDREFLIKAMYEGIVKAATGPISPGTPFHTDRVEQYSVNIKRANKLLDEAGYPRKSKGIRFSTNIHPIPSSNVDSLEVASYLRIDLLRKIGVNLKIIKSESFSNWASNVSNGNFFLALDIVFNWGDPVIGVHRTYSSDNIRKGVIWSNTQGYRNTQVDNIMKQAGTEMNFDKRKQLYEKFQRLVAFEIPVYWFMTLPYATIHHQNLEGLDNSIWGNMFPYDEVRWKD